MLPHEKPASYDRKSRYIEVAVPVKKGEEPVKGMILVSVSTDSLRDNVEALQSKARIATVAISIIGIFLAKNHRYVACKAAEKDVSIDRGDGRRLWR